MLVQLEMDALDMKLQMIFGPTLLRGHVSILGEGGGDPDNPLKLVLEKLC